MEAEQWEYELFSSTDVSTGSWFKQPSREAILNHLNALGAEGWEMINVQFAMVDGPNHLLRAILKRRKR
ncbi:MAG TPA: hypothetical protein VEK11_22290 [Thermoanaerobaculia bacterium]|nr:hypothetical protein [Thermoanaerobaculia bacterium]